MQRIFFEYVGVVEERAVCCSWFEFSQCCEEALFRDGRIWGCVICVPGCCGWNVIGRVEVLAALFNLRCDIGEWKCSGGSRIGRMGVVIVGKGCCLGAVVVVRQEYGLGCP